METFRFVGLSLASLASVLFGIYVAIWEFFIVGIVMVVEQIRAPTMNNAALAEGIARIVFCEIPFAFGVIVAWILFYCAAPPVNRSAQLSARVWR